MNDFSNFISEIKQVNKHRHHRITNSYGVYDAYKYYRKNKPKDKKYILTESLYFNIIRTINNILKDLLIKGEDVLLPKYMGRIELRKRQAKIFIQEGKVKTTLPIDWNKTLLLWYSDEEAYRDRILIRSEDREIFRIKYNKSKAKYNNKTFYLFQPNRDIKIKLKENIKNNLIDAFSYG